MAEEPTLPSLPKVSWDSHTQTFTNTRKRYRDGASAQAIFSNSSDPAVFSSDDDPHVDNYINGRHRKKRYVGSWFQQMPTSSDSTFGEVAEPQPKPKRTFERQWDSGVWMSDGSVDMDDEFTMDVEQPPQSKLPQLHCPRTVPSVAPEENLAIHNIIDTAIEEGNPDIDLSSLGVTSIPNGPISRLAELALIPSVDKDVPFEQSNPELGLYLSNNRLARAPGALFNLEHLTYLSLRNNKISELPPSIGKLRNLRELNLSLNRLRYLPGEILDLLEYPSALSSLHVHPNPFHRPQTLPPSEKPRHGNIQIPNKQTPIFESPESPLFSSLDNREGEGTSTTFLAAWQFVLLARSVVQYSDSRGSVLSKFQLPRVELDDHSRSNSCDETQHVTIQTEDVSLLSTPPFQSRTTDGLQKSSHVLSLFELASKSASRAAQIWDLTSYFSAQAPTSVLGSINRIATQSALNGNSGTLPCSICGRQITTPAAQWIEWWDISKAECKSPETLALEPLSMNREENAIPFLRRGCSWNCIPKPTESGKCAPGSVLLPKFR
ncbi:hypothetical protein F5B22DRAFT_34588 [Xylaria bambusicola]|uniref:uncharacterized protein n=1 Tax=Xylaria bambusicola TaxID=326684 RepID=UPI00200791C4|nr:uncharacterized protein F5B22DRAFT_34588 [Xylaria bambusicola]KAI0521020.1 hypothetical protein F5B22DRAFT_34588 [Xylaria bambusicola]